MLTIVLDILFLHMLSEKGLFALKNLWDKSDKYDSSEWESQQADAQVK